VTRAVAAAIVTGIQVGAALVASEAVVADVGAGRLGFIRYAIALCLILPVALRARGPSVARRDLLPVALIGIGQFGVLVALLNVAVLHAGSPRVALVFATLPVAALLLGFGFVGGRVSRLELVSIMLSVIGVGVLLGGDALGGRLGPDDWFGLGCAGAATLVGALCSHLYRPYLQRSAVTRVSAIAMAASLLPLGLMSLAEGQGVPPADWSTDTILVLAFVGVSSGFGFIFWLYALAHLPAPVVTAFLGLSPVTATAFAALFLGAAPTPSQLGAMALVVGSLAATALAQRRVRKTLSVLPAAGGD
jgi:drug/metabolite transporter (DMT)-like permease